MFCTKCGSKLPDGDNKCINCGYKNPDIPTDKTLQNEDVESQDSFTYNAEGTRERNKGNKGTSIMPKRQKKPIKILNILISAFAVVVIFYFIYEWIQPDAVNDNPMASANVNSPDGISDDTQGDENATYDSDLSISKEYDVSVSADELIAEADANVARMLHL